MNEHARRRRRANSARRFGSLLACGVAAALSACHEDVRLGGWHDEPVASLSSTSAGTSAGSGGATATLGTALTTTSSLASSSTATGGPGSGGAAGDTSVPPPLPACLAPATPGAINAPVQNAVLPTELATDWTWPEAVPSLQWELMVEREVVDAPAGTIPEIGYYYNHQFSLQEGIQGFFGIQAEGGYSAQNYQGDAWTKIAVFWLTAEDAQLGEIPAPYARVGTDDPNGVEYLTIHAVFDWQACRVYRFRVAPDEELADGRVWYGAWIEDVDAGVETLIGRMLVPAGAGMFNTLSTSRTQSIDFMNYRGCQYAQHASVLIGTPSSEDGLVRPTGKTDFRALGCPSSRFSSLDGAIRHEIMSNPEP